MTGVLTQEKAHKDRHTRGEGHVMTEAEFEVLQLSVKKFQE